MERELDKVTALMQGLNQQGAQLQQTIDSLRKSEPDLAGEIKSEPDLAGETKSKPELTDKTIKCIHSSFCLQPVLLVFLKYTVTLWYVYRVTEIAEISKVAEGRQRQVVVATERLL